MSEMQLFDAIVVGAGFGGVQMLHEFSKRGMSACGIEGGGDVGGAWYWNRYPGARCDVESLLYCYSFSPELDAKWRWSERYPPQAEIQRYIRFAADLWDVTRCIRFNTWVSGAVYDAARNVWTVSLDSGESIEATYLVMAVGPLTTVVWPDIPGREDFKGECYHTARWPDGVSLAGKRIGVIGNGSPGTQFMTEAAKTAGQIHAFVRTAHYSVPAHNAPLTPADFQRWEAVKDQIRDLVHQGLVNGAGDLFADHRRLFEVRNAADCTPEEQQARLEFLWNLGGATFMLAFADVMLDEGANKVAGDFVRAKVAGIVRNEANRDVVMPRQFAIGGKRIIVDTGFYEIFNQDNVFAHDIRKNPILRITEKGVETTAGEIKLDMLVFATGFDAATGSFGKIDIRGRDGLTLNRYWKDGALSYMGLLVHGFPNMMMVNGPGAPGPFSNVVISNEWCIETIMAIIDHMRANGIASVEADPAAEKEWMALVEALIAPTFFAKTENWYTGSNVKGKKAGVVNFVSPPMFREKTIAEVKAGFPRLVFGQAARP